MSLPIAIRKLDSEQIGHLRQIARRREPVFFQWLGREWSFRVSALTSERQGLSELRLDWGGAHARFRCDESFISQIAQASLGIEDEHVLQEEWRMFIIEAAFADLAGLVERHTRKRFVLNAQPGQAEPAEWKKFLLELDTGDHVSRAEIWLDQLGVGFLSNALLEIPTESANFRAWFDLPIRVRFLIGETRLAWSVFKDLARRDVILVEDCRLGDQLRELSVEIGGKLFATGEFAGRKITIVDDLEKSMDELDDSDLDRQDAYGELSIRLSFDLGERSLPLSELMSIGPGHVFELGREVRRAVFVRANGKLIGEGELVDVDGQIGVALLSIALPDASGR